ncbi:MAG: hypothetical protein M9962_06330 [Oligoflexia bacterium]|nr:hypothetical protein [Oligoflexia bacterium]
MKKISLFVFLLFACTTGSVHEDKNGSIQIFYNNDNISYLEPCGCRVSPIGGMIRRWNAFKKYPDSTRLFVDSGNLLFKSTTASDFLAPQWEEQAKGVIEAYNLLGADAVGIGETDFALGVDKLKEMLKLAKFSVLSANLVYRDNQKRVFAPYVVVERAGKKIGIFSVMHQSMTVPSELQIIDPIHEAKEAIRELKQKGAVMIIALSHQRYENDVTFIKEVKGIDLLVGANSQSLLQDPDEVNGTLLVQLSNQGQMLGMVEYATKDFPKNRTKFVVDELNAQYDESNLANPMKSLISIVNLKMEEANKKIDQMMWESKVDAKKGFQTFISCQSCHKVQAAFQYKQLHAASFLTLVAKHQDQNLDCVKCHSVGLGKVGGFRTMNEAFIGEEGETIPYDSLREKIRKFVKTDGKSYRENPHQVKTDVPKWIEFLEKQKIKKTFVTVQCESCHGAKPDHPFTASNTATKVMGTTCLQCHTKEQMPAWYDVKGDVKQETLAAAIKQVACPK